jgi:hypothetical protein
MNHNSLMYKIYVAVWNCSRLLVNLCNPELYHGSCDFIGHIDSEVATNQPLLVQLQAFTAAGLLWILPPMQSLFPPFTAPWDGSLLESSHHLLQGYFYTHTPSTLHSYQGVKENTLVTSQWPSPKFFRVSVGRLDVSPYQTTLSQCHIIIWELLDSFVINFIFEVLARLLCLLYTIYRRCQKFAFTNSKSSGGGIRECTRIVKLCVRFLTFFCIISQAHFQTPL